MEISNEVRLFHKIAGYYKWTWEEFRQTPWFVIKELSCLLDEKEKDMKQFIGYEEASMFKNLSRMFPSSE